MNCGNLWYFLIISRVANITQNKFQDKFDAEKNI